MAPLPSDPDALEQSIEKLLGTTSAGKSDTKMNQVLARK